MIRAEFWKSKRVFVTGHTGFKGSWLALWLEALGAEVTGYALAPPTDPSLFALGAVASGLTDIRGDIRDPQKLEQSLRQSKAEVLLHLAAQPLVRLSYSQPVETYSTNVMGTLHVLEAARKSGTVRVIVNVTTDKCYENREWYWGYREDEPMGGFDPYSSSKACSEILTAAYRRSYFAPDSPEHSSIALASGRAGNVIGGGDWALDRLVPDCIRAALAGESVILRNPQAMRPWQHVLEPLAGYLLLAQRLYTEGQQFAKAYNFGPEDSDVQSVERVVRGLFRKLSLEDQLRVADGPHPHEAGLLKLDCSLAKAELGWRPIWNLDQALDRIAEWVEAYQRNPADIRALCIQQIDAFSKEATGPTATKGIT